MFIYTKNAQKKNPNNVLNIERVFFSGNAKGKRKTKPTCNSIKSLKQTQLDLNEISIAQETPIQCCRGTQFGDNSITGIAFLSLPSFFYVFPPKSRTHQSNWEHVEPKLGYNQPN
jgi:hypothetical protein